MPTEELEVSETNLILIGPHGHVRCDDNMASDLGVVNAAKVSFAKHATTVGAAESGLIRYLMENKHGTPFEHNAFKFNIRCPIFVAREWFRHRWSSFNEESLRYSPARLDGYVPRYEDFRTQVGKPGAYVFEQIDKLTAVLAAGVMENAYEVAFDSYSALLAMGVAREQARMVLPVGMYTEFYWTLNARAVMNFISLRNDVHAQAEIREYAVAIESFFEKFMPVTHQAFVNGGRIAP